VRVECLAILDVCCKQAHVQAHSSLSQLSCLAFQDLVCVCHNPTTACFGRVARYRVGMLQSECAGELPTGEVIRNVLLDIRIAL